MGALARVWVPWGVPGWAHLKGGRTAPDASRLFLCCAWYLPASFFCVFFLRLLQVGLCEAQKWYALQSRLLRVPLSPGAGPAAVPPPVSKPCFGLAGRIRRA